MKKIKVNPAYIPLIEDIAKILLIYGGAGSGKSYFVAQKIVLRFIHEENHKILILRKQQVNIKDSVWALILEVLVEFEFLAIKLNKSDRTITNLENGNVLLFRGLDEPEKIKSVQGITSMWLEEATDFLYDDFTQLLLRIRGQHTNYIQYILTFNPVSEYHWLKTKIIDKLETLPEYKYVHTTYIHNKFLTRNDHAQLEALKHTNPLYYQIYCLGEWGVEDKSGKFAYAFDRLKHVQEGIEWNEEEYTYLTFDFNVNPITCTVIQWYDGKVRIPQCIKLPNSNIYALCDYINAKYNGAMFIVTGDASGTARSALVEDSTNYYTVIKDKLRLMDTQIQLPTVNPRLAQNKVLVNAVLQIMDVKMDKTHAEGLIFDLSYVEVNQDNTIKKANRADEKQKADALDTFRYWCNMFLKDILKYGNN